MVLRDLRRRVTHDSSGRRRLGHAVPQHVAFLMDGNRRWAREHGYDSPSVGHRYGAARAEQVLRWCLDADVHHVTVFVASIDNLRKRSATEIETLMALIADCAAERLTQQDFQIHLAGRIEEVPGQTAAILLHARDLSATHPTDFHLNIAIGYDGHAEIVDAVRSLLKTKARSGVALMDVAQDLTPEEISAHLYTGGQPDPGLVIRTSGEQRLSTFMPWQTAYSQLYFCSAHWPALSRREFRRALRVYANRLRRTR